MARGNTNSNGKQQAEVPKAKISKENLREALVLFSYLKPYRNKFILSLDFYCALSIHYQFISAFFRKDD